MFRIKKNDTVSVLSGKDAGRRGLVLDLNMKKNEVLVKDVAVVARHTKARRTGEVSAIKRHEDYIALSRVMPVCPSCDKPCRIEVIIDGERRARACHRCHGKF